MSSRLYPGIHFGKDSKLLEGVVILVTVAGMAAFVVFLAKLRMRGREIRDRSAHLGVADAKDTRYDV